jgi:hypothetical protein
MRIVIGIAVIIDIDVQISAVEIEMLAAAGEILLEQNTKNGPSSAPANMTLESVAPVSDDPFVRLSAVARLTDPAQAGDRGDATAVVTPLASRDTIEISLESCNPVHSPSKPAARCSFSPADLTMGTCKQRTRFPT